MNDKINNYEKKNVGYNVCPHCGRAPYETMDGYDTYRIGCVFCGINNGVITFIDDPITEEVKEATRKEWNRKCLTSSYTDGVMELMGLGEDDFVLTWRHDDMIECVARDVDDIIRIIAENEELYNIYQVRENGLDPLGTSKLVAIIAKKY